MTDKDWKNFETALYQAWLFAINSIGMEAFKKASFFGSNLQEPSADMFDLDQKPAPTGSKKTAA